ncbi:EF-hand domain-containing protein [Tamlana sp. s12]|uniref:EF-hand domain-containing protein n=1 Tax=Tamlana sp. s12 TaxID=1630406 RepID=UPI0007FF1892|nr:EF-hand domain-containing protein [Tamlana sp. s12]OBQ55845.1 hypothetical protein VQ01_05435 [Tamlana sp. s12]QQY83664.1 EF-hand domain-containing protein [Tamlana sp. s12]
MRITTLKLGTLALALFAFTSVEAQEKKKPDPEKAFKRFDANKDGSVTLEEFKSAKRKKEIPEDKLEKGFNRMDADSDGSVTLEEFKAAQEKGKKKKQD